MKILIFGGDARQISAAGFFTENGYDTNIFGIDPEVLKTYGAENKYTDVYTGFDAVVFPLPFSTDGEHVNCPFSAEKYSAAEIFRNLSGSRIFVGMAGKYFIKAAEEFGISLTDYYEFEDFQIKNAVPTAEGAIEIFLNRKDVTLYGSECIVTGCGKVGKSLAVRLSRLGANVIVAARSNKDLSWAETAGMKGVKIKELIKSGTTADCIFNTVPANIFEESFCNKLSADTVYVELASKPYGMSCECRKILQDRYIPAPSLPGKTAPQTAGRIIAETVCKYL